MSNMLQMKRGGGGGGAAPWTIEAGAKTSSDERGLFGASCISGKGGHHQMQLDISSSKSSSESSACFQVLRVVIGRQQWDGMVYRSP